MGWRDAQSLRHLPANQLENRGIRPDIIDLRWIRPLDGELIIKSVRKTGRLLVVDTGWKMFGIGSEVIARVCEAVGDLKALPRRIGLPDIPCPASHCLEKFYHPSTEDIVKTAIQMF